MAYKLNSQGSNRRANSTAIRTGSNTLKRTNSTDVIWEPANPLMSDENKRTKLTAGGTFMKIHPYGKSKKRTVWCSDDLAHLFWGRTKDAVKGALNVSDILKVQEEKTSNRWISASSKRFSLVTQDRKLVLEVEKEHYEEWVGMLKWLIESYKPPCDDIGHMDFDRKCESLTHLLKGGWLIKHTKGRNVSHKRFFFCSFLLDQIAWYKDGQGPGQARTVPTTDILRVESGCSSKGFSPQVANERSNQCFTLYTVLRTVDVEAESNEARDQWVRTFQYMIALTQSQSAEREDFYHWLCVSNRTEVCHKHCYALGEVKPSAQQQRDDTSIMAGGTHSSVPSLSSHTTTFGHRNRTVVTSSLPSLGSAEARGMKTFKSHHHLLSPSRSLAVAVRQEESTLTHRKSCPFDDRSSYASDNGEGDYSPPIESTNAPAWDLDSATHRGSGEHNSSDINMTAAEIEQIRKGGGTSDRYRNNRDMMTELEHIRKGGGGGVHRAATHLSAEKPKRWSSIPKLLTGCVRSDQSTLSLELDFVNDDDEDEVVAEMTEDMHELDFGNDQGDYAAPQRGGASQRKADDDPQLPTTTGRGGGGGGGTSTPPSDAVAGLFPDDGGGGAVVDPRRSAATLPPPPPTSKPSPPPPSSEGDKRVGSLESGYFATILLDSCDAVVLDEEDTNVAEFRLAFDRFLRSTGNMVHLSNYQHLMEVERNLMAIDTQEERVVESQLEDVRVRRDTHERYLSTDVMLVSEGMLQAVKGVNALTAPIQTSMKLLRRHIETKLIPKFMETKEFQKIVD